ncbi:MAG: cysteine hydrolase [Ruminococcus sp.]|nr:cysteine hydrolase [Ruminococcus sp.]
MKLLVVIDFQNDFVNGSLGFEGAELLDEKIADKIREYHENKDHVIFTLDTHDSNYLNTLEGKKLPVAHCIRNTKGYELYGKTALEAKDSDLRFEKNTFPSLDLANYLRGKVFESVELAGLVSNICVLSNAVMIKSALPETEIIVDTECTDSFDKALNEKCFDIMEGLQITLLR